MLPRIFLCSLLLFSPVCALAASVRETYKTAGDVKLTVDIDTPADWKPADKRPAIVFFFGGGWSKGTPESFKAQAEYFAKRGMVCLRPDYRVRGRQNVAPDKCVEDAISAMRWARANAGRLGIDPGRIVASGGSAGGHIAACTFFTEGVNARTDDKSVSPKPNAMVLYNPVLDMLAYYRAGQPFTGMSESVAKKISPAQMVKKDMPPTIIFVGSADSLYRQIKTFVEKGKKLGAPVVGDYTEGPGHGFFNRPQYFDDILAKTDAFLVRIGYLAPKSDGIDMPTASAKGKKGGQKGGSKGGGKKDSGSDSG